MKWTEYHLHLILPLGKLGQDTSSSYQLWLGTGRFCLSLVGVTVNSSALATKAPPKCITPRAHSLLDLLSRGVGPRLAPLLVAYCWGGFLVQGHHNWFNWSPPPPIGTVPTKISKTHFLALYKIKKKKIWAFRYWGFYQTPVFMFMCPRICVCPFFISWLT